jgi:methionyl-tRNA synthetase
MINRNCHGKVPELQDGLDLRDDEQLLSSLISSQEILDELRAYISDKQAFSEALALIWNVVREANQYVDRKAPWALKKTDPAAMNSVLYILAEVLRHLGILLWPFMPGSCDRLLDQLAVPKDQRAFKHIGNVDRIMGPYSLRPGTTLPAPQGVFPRYVEATEGAA